MDIIQTAEFILNKQLLGVGSLKDLIASDSFVKAIHMLLDVKGKVIISGIGKSGHIAQKIAATMSSTGTSSFFIHPSEASHGDLGMLGSNDALILISCSGDTSELKDIVFYAKQNQIKTVSIVGKKDSFLAENTDIALVTGNLQEAMPHLPAPTTSTTVMMVLGDIIAGCLSLYKKFDKNAYNKFHPGGLLGKSLSHIGDVIKKDDLPIVKINTRMHEVILTITAKKYGLATVLNDQGKILGVISDGDLRRHIEDGILDLTAKDVMSNNPKTVNYKTFVTDVIDILTKNKILTILVLDDQENFVGIAQLYDLIK